jgi:sarcosine oxidase subunit gamma
MRPKRSATVPETAERRSPVHHLLERRRPRWGRLGGAPIALRFAPVEDEARAVTDLALCDLSALPKLGIKGPGAEAWLRAHEIDLPPTTYDTRPLAEGGLIARLGPTDFFLEGGASAGVLARLSRELARCPAQVYRVERQDATFLLAGERALAVLAQVCSIDFRSAPHGRVILTRATGINVAVLPGEHFCLWVDCTYAAFFWEALAQIVEELEGRIVGAACVCPELVREEAP